MEEIVATNQFGVEFTREEKFTLFDSGCFNHTIKGFILMAMDELEVDRETKCNVLMRLSELFDDVYAEDAEEYYRNWR